MTGAKAGPWIAGTVFVSLVIVALAWFLGISPKLATASETAEQASSQRDQNDMAAAKIAVLKKQFVKLDEYKAQLAAAHMQIPTTLQLAAYERELAAIATAHEVTIVNLTVAASTTVVPVGAVVAAPPVTDGTDTGTAAAETDPNVVAAPAPTGPEVIPGFSQLPISIEVLGTWANVTAFLNDAQKGTQRLLLVTGLDAKSTDQADATGGKPATADGDLNLIINGSLYVLSDPAVVAVPPTATEPVPAPVLPVPAPDKNPLAPLG